MSIGITVAGSVVIGSGVGIPLDNISATCAAGSSQTQSFTTGVSQSFPTIVVSYGFAPITYSLDPFSAPVPAGLSFNTSTGFITGTATVATDALLFVNASDLYNRTTGNVILLSIAEGLTTTQAIASRTVTAGVNETGFVPVTYSGGQGTVTLGISPAITSLGLTFNTSNGSISGNATSTITATTYTVTATDSISQTSSKTFTMTVAAPSFSTTQAIASRTLTAGTADSFTPVTATGGYGTKVWGISPSLPGGLSFNTTNGLVSGTPTVTSGATTYTVTVTDGLSQTSSKTFSMTVNAPALTTTLAVSSRTPQINIYDSFTPVTASGGYGTKVWSISPSLPSGMYLNTSNGLVYGTLTSDLSTTSYTVTVTDDLSQTSSKSFSMATAYTPFVTPVTYDTNTYRFGFSTSSNNSIVVDRSSALYMWGTATSGQLGNNTIINRSNPVQIAPGTSWATVLAGGTTSIGLKSDGSLWSWGAGTSGVLGVGDTISRSSPTQIGSATNWNSQGLYKSDQQATVSAINNLSQLYVWGLNSSGQLGLGDTINRSAPVQVSGSWVSAAIGITAIALDINYRLYTWGAANFSRLGDGTTANRSSPVMIDSTNRYIDISNAGGSLIVTRNDFTIWTWGSGANGALGLNDTNDRSVPTQIGSSSWLVVVGGGSGGAGIRLDNSLWTWGLNTDGRLGLNDTINRSSPTHVGTGGWSWISDGGSSQGQAAVNNLNQLYIWGTNTTGKLGDGTTVAKSSPVQVTLGSALPTNTNQVLAVSNAGTWFVKTQLNDYSLWVEGFGSNSGIGPVNSGITGNRSSPVQVGGGEYGGLLDQWYAISTNGGNYALAIKSDRTLWAWGTNTYGQLGISDTVTRSSPVQIGTNSNWSLVSAGSGSGHSAAIDTSGNLYVWGRNHNGQLGDSSTINKSSPVQIAGTWTSVSLNSFWGTTHAINNLSKLYAWGNTGITNGFNYLYGDGSTINRSSPTIIGTSSWAQVSAGAENISAIRIDGTLWGWGLNAYGAVGDRTTVNRSVPTQVFGGGSWAQVVAGGAGVLSSGDFMSSTYAIKTNGTLWAWGMNANAGNNVLYTVGVLGTNDTVDRSSPTQIGSGSWAQVVAAAGAVIAISSTNNIFTWGLNNFGQLGDNSTVNKSSPVLVYAGTTPNVDYLVVGGGGGGGGNRGGGGGGGGFVAGYKLVVPYGGTINTSVGAGGSLGGENSQGGDGSNSTLSASFMTTVTAYGGGGGGNNYSGSGSTINGRNGGSGGGGGMTNASSGFGTGGVGVYPGSTYVSASRQGYNGGVGSINDSNGGGGGGALSEGGMATTSVAGAGGKGREWHDGVAYSGGGGGGTDLVSTGGAGGQGGGGAGAPNSGAAAIAGTNGTGGGGGGGGANNTSGAAGGSGAVIIRYPSVYPVAASTTGSPTVTTLNGYRYYKWTTVGSGSITF